MKTYLSNFEVQTNIFPCLSNHSFLITMSDLILSKIISVLIAIVNSLKD